MAQPRGTSLLGGLGQLLMSGGAQSAAEPRIEDIGIRAAGEDYDPAAFALLRRRQVLAHQRNGSLTEPSECTVMSLTWNVAGQPPSADAVRDALGSAPPAASPAGELPAIVAVGLQEVVDLNAKEVLLTDSSSAERWLELVAAELARWPQPKPAAAAPTPPPRRPFGARPAAAAAAPAAAAAAGTGPGPYEILASQQLVGVLLLVFVRRDLLPAVSNVRAAALGTGALGFLGNKGAAAVRLQLHHTTLALVCAHLSAHTSAADARDAEWRFIESRLSFALPRDVASEHALSAAAVQEASSRDASWAADASGGGGAGGAEDGGAAALSAAVPLATLAPPSDDATVRLRLRHHDVTVWLGDLNYRLAGVSAAQARAMVQDSRAGLRPVLQLDQLLRARAAGTAWDAYEEAPIMFGPTYKYDKGAHRRAARRPPPGAAELCRARPARHPDAHAVPRRAAPRRVWPPRGAARRRRPTRDAGSSQYDTSEKQRPPAWTDRVLWRDARVPPLPVSPPAPSAAPAVDRPAAQSGGGGGGAYATRRVRSLVYSRREVRLSDHRPVVSLLRVPLEVASAAKRAQLHRALDEWEESRIPSLELRPRELVLRPPAPSAPTGGEGGAAAPPVPLAAASAELRVRNTGPTLASFAFRAPPAPDVDTEGGAPPFPPWLVVEPAGAAVQPGQEVVLHARLVGALPAAAGGSQAGAASAKGADIAAEAVLLLRVRHGRDIFVPVSVVQQRG